MNAIGVTIASILVDCVGRESSSRGYRTFQTNWNDGDRKSCCQIGYIVSSQICFCNLVIHFTTEIGNISNFQQEQSNSTVLVWRAYMLCNVVAFVVALIDILPFLYASYCFSCSIAAFVQVECAKPPLTIHPIALNSSHFLWSTFLGCCFQNCGLVIPLSLVFPTIYLPCFSRLFVLSRHIWQALTIHPIALNFKSFSMEYFSWLLLSELWSCDTTISRLSYNLLALLF